MPQEPRGRLDPTENNQNWSEFPDSTSEPRTPAPPSDLPRHGSGIPWEFRAGIPHLVEEVGDGQVVVVEQRLLLGGEEPLAQRQARPRHGRGVVLHVQLVRELVGSQLPHWEKHGRNHGMARPRRGDGQGPQGGRKIGLGTAKCNKMTPKIYQNDLKILQKDFKILQIDPKILSELPQILQNYPKTFQNDPKIFPKSSKNYPKPSRMIPNPPKLSQNPLK